MDRINVEPSEHIMDSVGGTTTGYRIARTMLHLAKLQEADQAPGAPSLMSAKSPVDIIVFIYIRIWLEIKYLKQNRSIL